MFELAQAKSLKMLILRARWVKERWGGRRDDLLDDPRLDFPGVEFHLYHASGLLGKPPPCQPVGRPVCPAARALAAGSSGCVAAAGSEDTCEDSVVKASSTATLRTKLPKCQRDDMQRDVASGPDRPVASLQRPSANRAPIILWTHRAGCVETRTRCADPSLL
jgi:hypothetical protein